MQYTVVHSNDPYLLARLATDLQMEGCKQVSINTNNPFIEGVEWLADYGDGDFGLYSHNCTSALAEYRHELTSRNYIKVLTKILCQP